MCVQAVRMTEKQENTKGLKHLAKQVTEAELTQKRRAAVNPIAQST